MPLPEDIQKAVDWFRQKVLVDLKKEAPTQEEVLKKFQKEGLFKLSGTIEFGKMYLFQYDALHKDRLPWWDIYPLVFFIKNSHRGIDGINLHYLPMSMRLGLFGQLLKLKNNEAMDDTTKIDLTYAMLKRSIYTKINFRIASKNVGCYKSYIRSRISGINSISSKDWHLAATIPMEKWVIKK
jgi:hypothetical protein